MNTRRIAALLCLGLAATVAACTATSDLARPCTILEGVTYSVRQLIVALWIGDYDNIAEVTDM